MTDRVIQLNIEGREVTIVRLIDDQVESTWLKMYLDTVVDSMAQMVPDQAHDITPSFVWTCRDGTYMALQQDWTPTAHAVMVCAETAKHMHPSAVYFIGSYLVQTIAADTSSLTSIMEATEYLEANPDPNTIEAVMMIWAKPGDDFVRRRMARVIRADDGAITLEAWQDLETTDVIGTINDLVLSALK